MPTIPPLPPGTILLVEVGLTAHGTGLHGGEDHDERGVVVESAEEVLGIDERPVKSCRRLVGPSSGDGSYPGGPDRDRIIRWSTQAHLAAWGRS